MWCGVWCGRAHDLRAGRRRGVAGAGAHPPLPARAGGPHGGARAQPRRETLLDHRALSTARALRQNSSFNFTIET